MNMGNTKLTWHVRFPQPHPQLNTHSLVGFPEVAAKLSTVSPQAIFPHEIPRIHTGSPQSYLLEKRRLWVRMAVDECSG